MKLQSRVALVTLLVIGVARAAPADRIYIVEPSGDAAAQAERLATTLPQVEEEKIEAYVLRRAHALAELQEDLAPAPIQRDSRGAYFQGTIIQFFEGLHGEDVTERGNYDRILFRAYGPGGAPISRTDALIHGDVVKATVHEIDSPEDLVFTFSDRHRRLGVEFESPRHLDSLYRLVDPKGDLMLHRGGGEAPAPIAEGLITSFLLDGPGGYETLFRSGPYATLNPRYAALLAPVTGWAPGADANLGDEVLPLSVASPELLLSLARAETYPAIYSDLAVGARAAMEFLCNLARVDPATVATEDEALARRARQLGMGCLQIVQSALEPYGEPWRDPNNTALPIDAATYRAAALSVISYGNAFRFFTGAGFVDREAVDITPHWQFGGFGNHSFQIFHRLVTIVAGAEEDGFEGPPLVPAAREAMAHLLERDPAGDPEVEAFLELDRRYYRAILYRILIPSENMDSLVPAARWALCSAGWGDATDLVALAERLLSMGPSMHEPEARRGAAAGSLEAHLAELARIAGAGGAFAELGTVIEARISELRSNLERGFGSESEEHFLAAFDAAVAAGSICSRPSA